MKTATLEGGPKLQTKVPYIKWFHEIGIEDVPLVGGKTASLGEMFRELARFSKRSKAAKSGISDSTFTKKKSKSFSKIVPV
jgi:phosphoenolpyruvate synthase/pyruvate phosphate dikinase